jgi:hypothetical protein
VADIVDRERAGVAVAHQHVGFAGIAAEIAEAGNRPLQADRTHGGSRRDRVVIDVVDRERAVAAVAHEHIGRRE